MSATAYPFSPTNSQFGFGAVDIVVNMYTPEIIAEGRAPTDENFRDKVRVEQSHRRGLTLEQYIEKMDRAGIERSFLVAVRCGDLRDQGLDRNSLRVGRRGCRQVSAPVLRPRRHRSDARHRRAEGARPGGEGVSASSARTFIRTGSDRRPMRRSTIRTTRAAPSSASRS